MAGDGQPPECLTRWLGPGLEAPAGVLHVAAAAIDPNGLTTLRVGQGAPRSLSDAVVLSGARARAAAIVTTGRILRDESHLVHESIAPPEVGHALAGWRRRLGFEAPPLLAVLTARGELPPAHPALAAAKRLVVFTGESGARRLHADPATPTHAEIVVSAAPSARALIAYLRSERGAHSILIEAGASTSRELYEAPAAVDELWLSLCRSPVADDDRVGPFVDAVAIEAALGPPRHEETHDDAGLTWSTRVYRRSSQRPA